MTSRYNLKRILDGAVILPRRQLESGSFEDLSDPSVLAARRDLQMQGQRSLDTCVPFVLNVTQPMFVRLIALGSIKVEELVAICFRFDDLMVSGDFDADLRIYSHNPADPLAAPVPIGQLGLLSRQVEASSWYLERDPHLRESMMRARQAEISVPGGVRLDLAIEILSMDDFSDVRCVDLHRAIEVARRRDGW